MQLPNISDEQLSVIEGLSQNNNIIVDSVAGSGKTTCNLHIAKSFPLLNILLLTYNAKLKLETREKVSKLKIDNLETQSYHSFCVKHYDKKCYTDTTLTTILDTDQPLFDPINYDIIIIDEAQDMSYLYYQLVCKIYKDNRKQAKICIVGDKFQSIFQFNGADERFITMAEKLFNFNEWTWKTCKLSTSFRITSQMSSFINHCMLKDERIMSSKISIYKPRYLLCSFNSTLIFEEVIYYISLGYKPEDIFILAPSIKSKSEKSPIRILENRIKVDTNFNVYAASENEKIDSDIIKEKIVFATFHQTKGLERKVTIVLSFDESYFKFFNKNASTLKCPNELYVAVTRGIERLTLVHINTNKYLPFLEKNELEKYCHIVGLIKEKTDDRRTTQITTNPTELLSHLPSNVLDECMALLNIETIRPPCEKIHFSSKTKKISKDSTCESVSELTGVAIPTYYELQMKGVMNIYNILITTRFPNVYADRKVNREIRSKLEKICIEKLTSEDLLFIVNCWDCSKSNLLFKMYQIKKYDWLPQNKLLQCIDRLSSLQIPTNAKFELQYDVPTINSQPYYVTICDIRLALRGYVDCLDDCNLYEFKCVSELSVEHHLQLAIYMYMDQYIRLQCENKLKEDIKTNSDDIEKIGDVNENFIHYDVLRDRLDELKTKVKDDKQFLSIKHNEMIYYLYNVLSDELIRITCDMESLTRMMEILITHKYFKSTRVSDLFFLEKVNMIHCHYFKDTSIP